MPGFSNGCVYFEQGIDPRGTPPVANQMGVDGRLLIGSAAAPYVVCNTLTAGTGVSITNAPGSITVSSTGALNLIQTLSAANSATITFNNIPAGYHTYFLAMRNVTSKTNDVDLTMVMSKDNGVNWIVTNYQSAVVSYPYDQSLPMISNSTTLFELSRRGISNASADQTYNGHLYIYGTNLASKPYIEGRACLYSAHDSITTFNNIFGWGGDTNLNALQFSMTAGNIDTGVFSLYGLVE